MFNKILYKKDSKGKIRFLRVEAKGSQIIESSGLVGTTAPVVHIKEAVPKNVGRSNETTAEEQAVLEAESKIARKLKGGYFEDIEDAKFNVVVLPMLVKDLDEEKAIKALEEQGLFMLQPKLDGMRMLLHVFPDSLKGTSREGTDIPLELLFDDETRHKLYELAKEHGTFILDGEIYRHGFSFQEVMRSVRKYRADMTPKISYNVYDLVDTTINFFERYEFLHSRLGLKKFPTSKVNLVETIYAHDKPDLSLIAYNFNKYIEYGYEGVIVRFPKGMYKLNGRSDEVFRLKEFKDMDVIIKDVVPAEQRPDWGKFVVETPVGTEIAVAGGKTFTVTEGVEFTVIGGSHEERRDFLKNKEKYIGRTIEVRYFDMHQDGKNKGKPRMPTFSRFRPDKD